MTEALRHLTLQEIEEKLVEYHQLQEQFEELQILYETILEHSTLVENELEEKNKAVTTLLSTLRKYLSPQLYDSIVGGTTDTQLGYKRQMLTVFFSDIVGFTQISDITAPEILSLLLNEYLNEMSKIALKFGGTIDKYIGDAVMIFFGDPHFIDDATHAQQCALMALEMQQKVQQLSHHWRDKGISLGLSVRMGIHSGYCTVGNFGSESRMDYTIIGGTVNIASRLEHIAMPNTVFTSRTTYDLIKPVIAAEQIGEVQVKGVSLPIEVFKLKGPLKQASVEPILQKTDKGFILEALEFDAANASPEMRQNAIKSLKKALKLLQEF